MKSFSGLKKVAGKGDFQDGRQNGEIKTNECVKLVIHY